MNPSQIIDTLVDKNNYTLVNGGTYSYGLDEKNWQLLCDTYNRELNQFLKHSVPMLQCTLKDFYFAKHFITVEDFNLFQKETKYRTLAEEDGWGWIMVDKWKKEKGACWRYPFGEAHSYDSLFDCNLPVLQISWYDAEKFCIWLSEKTNIKISLPSEKQWEIAAIRDNYSSLLKRDFHYLKFDAYSHDSYIESLKSQDKQEHFSRGLLWEWTSDWFDKYNGNSDFKEYGDIYKVLRGGSIFSNELQRTSEYRFRRCPTARSPYYGFRIVLEY